MTVQTYTALQRPSRRAGDTSSSSTSLNYYSARATYAAMYTKQPHVRTVVDFIARNIAQLGLHVFRRLSDTDRERLHDHELAEWMRKPNPATTGYALIEALMQDLGIFGVGYWLKVRGADRVGLVRMPPLSVHVEGWLMPTRFVWERPDGAPVPLDVRDVVYFRYFNPDDPLGGLSPLETLRQLLSEQASADTYRRNYWLNAARIEGVITRPLGAPNYTAQQTDQFLEQWRTKYRGQPGQVALLPPGMEFEPTSYSARDSEYVTARKLSREEVAAAYHVPLPMVGILDHATFSNIREQHKNLYQDCLGPSLEMIQQELERQVLPECDDHANVYCEFNIADKLKGSFEEQAAALQQLVGRPVMTPNEGRARLNLPAMADDATANELALPLNMTTPSFEEDWPTATAAPAPVPALRAPVAPADAAAAISVVPIIRATWARQRARLAKLPPGARPTAFDIARWNRELAGDLEQRAGRSPHEAAQLARTINAHTLQLLVARHDAFSDAREAGFYVYDSDQTAARA